MRIRMRRMKHRKPMLDQHRIWRTEGRVGETMEPLISTGMSARMATIQMWMKWNDNRKLMMDQRRMWRTKGIVLESGEIRLNISDL